MGNASSNPNLVNANNSHSIVFSDDPFWNPPNMNQLPSQSSNSQDTEREEHRQQLQLNLHEFKQELERKHEKRRQLIAEKRKEFQLVKEELEKLRVENGELKFQLEHNEDKQNQQQMSSSECENVKQLKEDKEELNLQIEKLKIQLKASEEVNAKNKELRITVSEMQLDLQKLNSEMLNIEQERLEYSKHITALKDVVRVTKDMLAIRESQIQSLKNKVQSVEELLASTEMKIMSDGLREEYEQQLRNIRNLRTLYEERQRLDKIDKEHLQVQLEEAKKQIENEQKISSDRLERIEELEQDTSKKYDEITNLRSSLGLTKAECTELQAEIDVINQLFSQILLGFNNSPEIDFDKLRHILEENHDLLTDIASNEESLSTAAALPKVLLDLINQINNENDPKDEQTVANALHQLNSPAEIVETLPKVWKVLIELLSHQNPPLSALKEGEKDPCYKSVETPTGPKLKLSVSQTFIRLKDLIIEKKFLEREMYRLKHLNTHLEGRLQDQEKRLELVSDELTTTWHVVEKMQRQHQQLHTHEKVLRYELHEKRKLLAELKEELQYCRDKWVQARAKNDTTQEQWKELRKEFAARKTADDFNQSAESGYSDDKDSSEEDEKGYESDVSDTKRESDSEDLENTSAEKTNKESNKEVEEENETSATVVTSSGNAFAGLVSENDVGVHLNANAPDPLELSTVNANAPDPLALELSTITDTNVDCTVEVDNSSSNVTQSEVVSCSTGAIKKTSIEKLQGTNSKTKEERLELDAREETNVSTRTDSVSANVADSRLGVITEEGNTSAENKAARTPEEIFAAREERLRRLEEESSQLFQKVSNTKVRSNNISNKLDSLHEIYGQGNSANSGKELLENLDIGDHEGAKQLENVECKMEETTEEEEEEENSVDMENTNSDINKDNEN